MIKAERNNGTSRRSAYRDLLSLRYRNRIRHRKDQMGTKGPQNDILQCHGQWPCYNVHGESLRSYFSTPPGLSRNNSRFLQNVPCSQGDSCLCNNICLGQEKILFFYFVVLIHTTRLARPTWSFTNIVGKISDRGGEGIMIDRLASRQLLVLLQWFLPASAIIFLLYYYVMHHKANWITAILATVFEKRLRIIAIFSIVVL